MTLTRHFHRIKGTTLDDQPKPAPRRFINCGGPGTCLDCTTDELDAFKLPPKFAKDSKQDRMCVCGHGVYIHNALDMCVWPYCGCVKFNEDVDSAT